MVVRTKAAYGRAFGMMIDNENYDEVLGTVAGDDTIFVLFDEGVNPLEFLHKLDTIHPNIKRLYDPNRRKHAAKLPVLSRVFCIRVDCGRLSFCMILQIGTSECIAAGGLLFYGRPSAVASGTDFPAIFPVYVTVFRDVCR